MSEVKAKQFNDLPKDTQKKIRGQIEDRNAVAEEHSKANKTADKLKSLKSKIDARIMKYLHRNDGGVHNTVHDGKQVYAQKVPVYSLQPEMGRIKLDDWVVFPLVEAEVPAEVIQEVIQRLRIFKNDPVKSAVEIYRIDTGAKQIAVNKDTTELVGGDLPGGVRMHYRESLGFRKPT